MNRCLHQGKRGIQCSEFPVWKSNNSNQTERWKKCFLFGPSIFIKAVCVEEKRFELNLENVTYLLSSDKFASTWSEFYTRCGRWWLWRGAATNLPRYLQYRKKVGIGNC